MVMEIPFNFQICVQCAEKAISKIASISHEILARGGEFFLRGHPPQLNMYLTVLALGWFE